MATFQRFGRATRGTAKRTASAASVGGRAAVKQEFRMHGLKELQDSLNRLPDQLRENALKNASAAAARVIRDEAKRRVKVNTGQLRDSIVVSRTFKEKGRKVRLRGAVVLGIQGAARYYAHLVEFGSSRLQPRPFMRPAMEAKAREALDAMAARLKVEVERAIRKLPVWHLQKARRDLKAARRSVQRRVSR